MAYVILIGSLVVTFFVRRQIVYWKTITVLGFCCETPEKYMRSPITYNCVSWLLVFGLLGAVSWFTEFRLWVRTVVFLIAVLVAEMEGKLKATDQYRRILREMLEDGNLDSEERERILLNLSKSTSELLREGHRIHRIMSGKF